VMGAGPVERVPHRTGGVLRATRVRWSEGYSEAARLSWVPAKSG
jgi:hypothetical protein